MLITMLCTRAGSEDGHGVRFFHKGTTYELADTLARYFIANGYALETQFIDHHLIQKESL